MNVHEKYNTVKLLFRRQFILGPHFIEKFPSWKRVKIRNTLCLTIHPDLNVCQVASENKSLTLLGYILDPNNPHASDSDIINSLLQEVCNCSSLDSFFECTYILGGRWILIVDNGQEIRLFHDACGYRQVYYTDTSFSRAIWCASQTGIIAETLNLEMDGEAQEFIKVVKAIDTEYWWSGDTSPYKEIKHLLPNHYLNLGTGLSQRYWPDRNLEGLSLEESVEKNAAILKGLVKSAHKRFDLALTLTAGRDSRLILAASKEICNDIFYCTLMYWNLHEDSADIKIPSRLLSGLRLKHTVIKCPTFMEDEFEKIYKRNVITAHDVYGTIAQGLYDYYPQERICMKGNAIPIVKSDYGYRLSETDRKNITVQILTKLIKKEGNIFVTKALENWLSGARKVYNIDILDLFWWEEREGNWQAMSQTELDIVQEVFVPFNCRTLLTNMLSVNEKHRRPPAYKMHKMLITYLWPELLGKPINPHKRKGIKVSIKGFLKKHLSVLRGKG